MPGSETVTTAGASDIIDSFDTTQLPSRTNFELRNEWNKLVLELRGATFETNLDERHSREYFETALELALTHPEVMSISTKPVSRRHDMTSHVRGHFDNVLNTDSWAESFKRPRPSVEYLLMTCGLAYLYNCVYRFSRETIVSPDLEGLEDASFVELPSGIARWMGDVDLLWHTLSGKLAPEEPLEETVERLHAERDSFVSEAKDREIFLPVRSEYVDDVDSIEAKIERRLLRNARVPPKLVHDYCFTQAADRY
ncbi:hypothetical protein ACYJ1Y_07270 [Natrialbaceae archaeon A-gly3]